MASVSTYLNFMGNTEEAFMFYKTVFGTEFEGEGITRMKEVPPYPGQPELTAEEEEMVMHVSLPITGGHLLMGTDMLSSMGHELKLGNNVNINLQPDTREETERLFNALKDGANDIMELQEMFWGDYFGSLQDKFGIHWMFNCEEKGE